MHPSRRGLTRTDIIALLIFVGVIAFLMKPAVNGGRGKSPRRDCVNRLKNIGLALHNYHDFYGEFPPLYTVDDHGRRLHSWRTLLLPYLDQHALYREIDLTKSWDDPVNAVARATPIASFVCPSHAAKRPMSSYVAIVSRDGVMRPDHSLSLPAVTDGTRETLLVIEVDAEHAVPWMSPEDIDEGWWLAVNSKSRTNHSGVIHGLMADGSVRFFALNVPTDVRKALVTATAGDKVPNDF